MTLAVVALGGALGAVSRYLASGWVQGLSDSLFPWGTFAVNVAGSLALGFGVAWLHSVASAELRDFVTVGFLGSFTTFSTFSHEAVAMLRDGEWWRAGLYVGGSVVVGVLAVVAGMALASSVIPGRAGG